MSGRSAIVRKKKGEARESSAYQHYTTQPPEYGQHYAPSVRDVSTPDGRSPSYSNDPFYPQQRSSDHATIRSSGSDDAAYARAKRPHVPPIVESQIEKSGVRRVMDQKSAGVRKGISNLFGGNRKKEEKRSESVAMGHSHELDANNTYHPSSSSGRPEELSEMDYVRSAPTQKLPPVPGQVMKRWMGHGTPPKEWRKMSKDPELWDMNGDVQVFFCAEGEGYPPVFQLSSHIIEATGSRQLITKLHQGYTDDSIKYNGIAPKSPEFRDDYARGPRQLTPPHSNGSYTADAQVSYLMYFPPSGESPETVLRNRLAIRNVFALLYGTSLVGTDLFQALNDLLFRLQQWMPEESDPAGMIIDYIARRDLDDVRYAPMEALGLLAFYEQPGVQHVDGWKDVYVHLCGMFTKEMEDRPEFRQNSPITRAMIQKGGLEVQVKVESCQMVLENFDYDNIWTADGISVIADPSTVGRSSFNRLRTFFIEYYASSFQTWPPPNPKGQPIWLSKDRVRKLSADFAALYDYFVDRDAVWDSTEERSGRKWNIVHPENNINPDSAELPFTDLVVAYDYEHKYPHIPCPYPLVPTKGVKVEPDQKHAQLSTSRTSSRPVGESMIEKQIALAYTNATNIYRLGTDYQGNALVDAFVTFEKADKAGDVNPYEARRGRWLLIYCVLQTLGSISVDTPNIKYPGCNYYLNPPLGSNMPPWKGVDFHLPEANHTLTHCWTVREKWRARAEQPLQRRPPPLTARSLATLSERGNYGKSSTAPSVASSDAASSMRSPTLTSLSIGTRQARRQGFDHSDTASSYTGYSQGIEKVEDWPTREQVRRPTSAKSPKSSSSREASRTRKRDNSRQRTPQHPQPLMGDFVIKDFDDNWPDDWNTTQI